MTEIAPKDFFQLNVGHIIQHNIGYYRDYDFITPSIRIQPDLELIDFDGSVRVTKTARGLIFGIKMVAKVICECVRCLENHQQTLTIDTTELFVFSPDDLDERSYLLPDNGKVDLTPFVRDEMLLSIPIKPICRQDCLGLCPICGENMNENQCNHAEDNIDPRFAGLQAFLNTDPDSGV